VYKEAETMTRRTWLVCLAAAALPVVGGCATYASLAGNEANKVYGGARLDGTLVREGLSADSKPSQSNKVERPVLVWEACCGVMDMPLSLAADTVLLPVTVPLALCSSSSDSSRTETTARRPASDRADRFDVDGEPWRKSRAPSEP
jgi:uncharacterized protein YceK